MDYLDLKRQLEDKLTSHESESNRLIGQCNDHTLSLLIEQIKQTPESNLPFLCFTQSLNFSYSTRLQLGENGRNQTVIEAAKILKENWYEGAALCEVDGDQSVNWSKVDILRHAVGTGLRIYFYSFTTKVFHQLNNRYPIIDSNVKKFMAQNKFSGKINFSSPKRSYKCFYEKFTEMMEQLAWDKNDVEGLDMAIWQFITDQEAETKKEKKLALQQSSIQAAVPGKAIS